MKVIIDLSKCEFLGNNLYNLPFTANDCSVLYEGYEPITEFFWGYSIGVMYALTYKPKFYLHTSNRYEQIIFDSDLISNENRWN